MKSISDSVAANMRRLRAERGLTLSELGRRSKVGKATLSNLEAGRGNPRLETLWALAVAFDVSFGQLLEPEPQPVQV
ncbi:MAG: helix-turn-helix domain-containing protein, partial [Actinomycetota bacterium]|nr:helix-turn-helix domain-containing protein [Actinomycetota bacterium]